MRIRSEKEIRVIGQLYSLIEVLVTLFCLFMYIHIPSEWWLRIAFPFIVFELWIWVWSHDRLQELHMAEQKAQDAYAAYAESFT